MIRPATLSDIASIVELGVAFMNESQYHSHLTVSELAHEKLAHMLIEAPHGEIFLAEREDEIVGMIGVIATHHPHSGDKVMSELFWYVRPAARGTAGLGVRLLRTAEAWAKCNGITKSLVVAPNEEVERLYQRMNYQRLEVQYIRTL